LKRNVEKRKRVLWNGRWGLETEAKIRVQHFSVILGGREKYEKEMKPC
jgi:hypothetical protein